MLMLVKQEQQIIIDSIAYQSLPQVQPDSDYKEVDFDRLDPGQLWRFILNLEDGSIERQMLESRCCEFPTHHPDRVGRDYRYLYIGAAANDTGSNAPLQAILKLDLETGERQLHSFAPSGFVSEPIFVPKPNSDQEDAGWVLTLVYDGSKHRSTLAILDAEKISGEAIALLHLKHHIPLRFTMVAGVMKYLFSINRRVWHAKPLSNLLDFLHESSYAFG